MTLELDKEGFKYPILDSQKCINCGLCKLVCPMEATSNKAQFEAFAGYSRNNLITKNSSSGGIFSEFSTFILENGGIVFGAHLKPNFEVTHIGINTINDLNKIQGSKYVQSDIDKTFEECKNHLLKGLKVFYVGVPCQIYALKKYMREEYSNLYTADLICHGVPSVKIFKNYIQYLEKHHNGILSDINFRDKDKNGWSITLSYKIKRTNKTRTYYKISSISEYFTGFLTGLFMRESCYNCPFASSKRYGDLTLGDFWGYQKTRPDLRNDDGLSLLLCNNQKGKEMLNILRDRGVHLTSIDENSVLKSENKNLFYPTNRPEIRNTIYRELDDYGFEYIAKKYMRNNFTLKNKIKNIIPAKIIKNIKGVK